MRDPPAMQTHRTENPQRPQATKKRGTKKMTRTKNQTTRTTKKKKTTAKPLPPPRPAL
jgi:hypothetical protein